MLTNEKEYNGYLFYYHLPLEVGGDIVVEKIGERANDNRNM